MSNSYDPVDNFTSRLKVDTAYPDGTKDHRHSFTQEEYRRNMQSQPSKTEGGGFQNMESVTQAPKPKGGTKQIHPKPTNKKDQALEAANKKDLQQRNIK